MFNIKMIAAVVIYAFLAVDINSKRYLGDFLYGFIIINRGKVYCTIVVAVGIQSIVLNKVFLWNYLL